MACALAAPAAQKDGGPTDDELLVLARLLAPIRELSERAGALESLVEKAAGGDDSLFTEMKRQGAWDQDYGWGGGRFGKRTNHGKRYDMYGMSGRFGRDVSRASRNSDSSVEQ